MRKRILLITTAVMLLLMTAFGSVTVDGAAEFKDVSEKDWFYTAVTFAVKEGQMNGVGSGKFAPEETVTRAMLATVLYRMSGSQRDYKSTRFKDNKAGEWYFDGVEYCYRNGIVEGYGDGIFGVDDPVTRQDMMTMFYRFSLRHDYVDGKTEDVLKTYADRKKVAAYARTPINWCLSNNVVEGVSYTGISPESFATRAQLAQILMNYYECVFGVNINDYRMSEDNPHGVGVRGIRMYDDKISFRLTGLQYALSDGTLSVDYQINKKSVFKEQTALEDHATYSYLGDASVLYKSREDLVGTLAAARVVITLSNSDGIVFKRNISFGKLLQYGSFDKKLYLKGESEMDCRILLYHDFAEEVTNPALYGTTTTPERLEEDILYLIENGYTFVPLKSLIEFQQGTRALPQKSVVITADDGYVSNYTLMYPVLQKYNVPATVFVVVGAMNTDGKLTWDMMREMESSGLVDIQSHSLVHDNHTTYMVQQLQHNVKESFEILDRELGKETTRIFAYPYGAYNDMTVETVKNCDVKMQVTTSWRAIDLKNGSIHSVPRLTVSHHSDIRQLMSVDK